MSAIQTPVAHPDLLHSKCPAIVEKLQVENVLPGLRPYLSDFIIDDINIKTSQNEKAFKLIEYLHPLAHGNCEAFTTFLLILAGTQPDLFTELVGREPHENEKSFAVHRFSELQKQTIREKGHQLDSPLDTKIDLETEHVKLMVARECDQTAWSNDLIHHDEIRHREAERQSATSPLQILNVEPGEKSVSKVLIQGRPGTGKTTTSQWMTRKWSLNEWGHDFILVFVLQLRFLLTYTDHMSAVELLALHSLYQNADRFFLSPVSSWLGNNTTRFMVFLDGLDEISGISKLLRDPHCRLTDPYQKAKPIELIVNILKGNMFPFCTIVCTSRPFPGLKDITFDRRFEVLALNEGQIREFNQKRYPLETANIMYQIKANPLLLSLCGIVFYCSLISSLVAQGVIFQSDNVNTYTRLMCFIIIQHVERSSPDCPFVVDVKSYFQRLAALAHYGMFGNQVKGEVIESKLIFDQYDVSGADLTHQMLQDAQRHGLLLTKNIRCGHRHTMIASFPHLSMHELLGSAHMVAHVSNFDIIKQLFHSGQFNMVLLYLFGFAYDKQAEWVRDIRHCVGGNRQLVSLDEWLERPMIEVCEDSSRKLMLCQIAHEAQSEELARKVSQSAVSEDRLALEDTQLTLIDLMAVRFVCQFVEDLKMIKIRHCRLTDSLIEYTVNSLFKPHIDTVQEADFSFNGISASCAAAVSQALINNTTLVHLYMRGNDIKDEGAAELSKALMRNGTLQRLHISQNSIGTAGAVAISKALSHNTTLVELYIYKNKIGPAGAAAFSKALVKNHTLKGLHMRDNNIQDEGVIALAKALVHNRTLELLYVGMNNIGAAGAVAISKALVDNQTLKKLHIWGNNIQDQGAVALGEALRQNKILERLDINRNNIGATGAAAISEALHYKTSLLELYLYDNNIDVTGEATLREAAAVNGKVKLGV